MQQWMVSVLAIPPFYISLLPCLSVVTGPPPLLVYSSVTIITLLHTTPHSIFSLTPSSPVLSLSPRGICHRTKNYNQIFTYICVLWLCMHVLDVGLVMQLLIKKTRSYINYPEASAMNAKGHKVIKDFFSLPTKYTKWLPLLYPKGAQMTPEH